MKKVVLISLPSPFLTCDRDYPNLGLLYIASYLRDNGIDVQVADLTGLSEENWYIPAGDIYGISAVTPQHVIAQKVIRKLKARQPDAFVVMGGIHATTMPERCLAIGADVVVRGEGEEWMLLISKNKRLLSLNNAVVDGEFIEKIDSVPIPARDLVDYWSYKKEANIITSRGCPYNCSFCSQQAITQRKVRYYSIDRIIEEVKHLRDYYGKDTIYIRDDVFTLDEGRVCEISTALFNLGIKWHCMARTNTVNETMLTWMKEHGCYKISFGIESGSQKMLDIANKHTTVEQNAKAIELTHNVGMKIRCFMMVGLPKETWGTVEETAKFMREHPYVNEWSINIFVPYPGCDIWNNPDKYGITINKNTDFSNYLMASNKIEEDVLVGDPDAVRKMKWYLREQRRIHE